MPLDIDRVLSETFVARAEYLPTVGSTNDYAAECAAREDGELPLLVVTDCQTAGRGRGANRWWAGPGALTFSLLMDPRQIGGERGPTPLAALAVAVAVVETVGPRLPDCRVGLHWPNDVMAGGRKLAGILIEALPDRRHIVGIGVNANNTLVDAPEELRARVGTLRDLGGCECDQTAVLVELLQRLQRAFERLSGRPEQIARQADAMCLQRGSEWVVRQGDVMTRGVCCGIADDGALRMETHDGERLCYSGTLSRPV